MRLCTVKLGAAKTSGLLALPKVIVVQATAEIDSLTFYFSCG